MQLFTGIARRVVALSSGDVYRACGVMHGSEEGGLQALPLTESSELRTNLQTYPPAQIERLKSVFGWLDDAYDKISVERAVLNTAGLPGTVVRLPMVYGPGDPLRRVGSVLDRLNGSELIVFERRHAAWRAPRGYVENVAEAVALAATTDVAEGRIYNVAEPDALSELEWAQEIAAAIGWAGRFETVDAENAPPDLLVPGNLDQHWVVDSTRIRQELGYRERVPRNEAIAYSIGWEEGTAA
jgi:nucleoside-diphosphate-sugar epimerase